MQQNILLNKIKKILRTDSKIEFCRLNNKKFYFSLIRNRSYNEPEWKNVCATPGSDQGIYHNFNVKNDILLDFLKVFHTPNLQYKNEEYKIQCTDCSSFNPTGVPHVGNLQVLIQGAILKRIKELLFKDLRIDSIYFVNDIGGQIGKIWSALNYDTEIEGYDIEGMRKIKHAWSLPEITEYFLTQIKKKMFRYDDMEHRFVYESSLDQLREQVLRKIMRYTDREGKAIYVPYRDDKIFLVKEDQEPTYILSDLALQWSLRQSYGINLLIIGKDHLTHTEHLSHLLSLLGIKQFIRIQHVGKLKIVHDGVVKPLSKRKIVEMNNLHYPVLLLKLGLFLLRKTKDNVLTEDLIRDLRAKGTDIVVSLFRIRGKVRYISDSEKVNPALAISLSQFGEALLNCVEHNDTYSLSVYCYNLAREVNSNRDQLWNSWLWLRLSQTMKGIRILVNV